MKIFDLTHKTILVTGGYGYLGRTVCRALASCGALVYVLARSERKFRTAFTDDNPLIRFSACDISSTPSVRETLHRVHTLAGGIHVLINNAVYVRGQEPLEIDDDEWKDSVDGVLSSVYRCIREVAPYFREQRAGKIINVSSMYGIVSPDFRIYDKSPEFLNPPHYGAAKAGVIQITKYFAQYLGPHNIQVNAISPGPFPNEEIQKNKRFVSALKKRTALRRIGKPEDLQGAFVFLSSDAANFITGHNLLVDGGWTIS
jgi:gluconate 5-dehydrogenase